MCDKDNFERDGTSKATSDFPNCPGCNALAGLSIRKAFFVIGENAGVKTLIFRLLPPPCVDTLCDRSHNRRQKNPHSTQFSGNASTLSPSPCHWAGIPPCWVISHTDHL